MHLGGACLVSCHSMLSLLSDLHSSPIDWCAAGSARTCIALRLWWNWTDSLDMLLLAGSGLPFCLWWC